MQYLSVDYENYPGAKNFSPELLETIKDELPLEGNLLDIGCGLGTLKQYLEEDVEYVGLDSSLNATKYWTDGDIVLGKLERTDTKIKAALPFAENSFDFVFCKDLIVHLDENMRRSLFEEISRVLKDSGKLMLISYLEPNKGSIAHKKIGSGNFKLFYIQYSTMKEYELYSKFFTPQEDYALVYPFFIVNKETVEQQLMQSGFKNINSYSTMTTVSNWYKEAIEKSIWVYENTSK